MGLYRQIYQRIPSRTALSALPTFEDLSRMPQSPRLSFLKRRLRLKGSAISVPIGVILLFPVIVAILVIALVLHTPEAPVTQIFTPETPPSLKKINDQHDRVFQAGCLEPEVDGDRANATFVVLARNKELEGVIQSMKSIERHFNRWFHYPYVFLNDEPFNSTFKETVAKYTSSKLEFGIINSTTWGFPDWVDKGEARELIAKQGDKAIMYGGMESYHQMCRFYSGYFFKHDLLQKYKWYWRLEPEVKFFCDITYDPFIHMERANKTYGWTIIVKELVETVPNLFRYASAFKRKHNLESQGMWELFLAKPKPTPEPNNDPPRDGPGTANLPEIPENAMEGETYNMCHFWSNFEIARLDFFRSPLYEEFFRYLESSGGFWQERWGDAPVHSLAAGILLGNKDVHYFRDFGYRHTTIQHCPKNAPDKQLERTPFYDKNEPDEKKAREEDDYWQNWDAEQPNGVGCRCRCDTDIGEIEETHGTCIPEWVDTMGGWAS